MSKADERAALEALMAGVSVTKIAAAPMDASLSASFKQVGIAKKGQRVSTPKAAKLKRKRLPKRNWEAQRRYDEEHGTDNGYDPRIEAWRNEQ